MLSELPLSSDLSGQLHMAGHGHVSIHFNFQDIVELTGQGTIYRGYIFDDDGDLVMEVTRGRMDN